MDEPSDDKWIQLAVRLPRAQLEQMDALLSWVRGKTFGGEANRSTIIREAVSRGLQSLQYQRDTERLTEPRLEPALEVTAPVTMTTPSGFVHHGLGTTWLPKTLDEALSWAGASDPVLDGPGGDE